MSRVLMTLATRSLFWFTSPPVWKRWETVAGRTRGGFLLVPFQQRFPTSEFFANFSQQPPRCESFISTNFNIHMAYHFSSLISVYCVQFRWISRNLSILVHCAFWRRVFFSRRRGFFPRRSVGKNSAPGKKNPAPGKKKPGARKAQWRREKKTRRQKAQWTKIARFIEIGSTIWVVARDEATKEIGHEHIIFPREDRGFRSNYEKIDQ